MMLVYKRIFLLIVILFFYLIIPSDVYALDYKNGHFEKINTDYHLGMPVQFNDGRVFIISDDNIINFDPNTNKFKKIATLNTSINKHDNTKAIGLNQNKILFIAPLFKEPSEQFEHEIYWLILNDLYKYKSLYFGDKNIKTTRDAWRAYKQLPEIEREKIYLPYLKKDPDLIKKYYDYIEDYKKSMYAQLFDIDSYNFEYTGKLNLRRSNSKKVLLKDGSVLLFGGFVQRDNSIPIGISDSGVSRKASVFEVYNPDTNNFSLIKSPKIFNNINDLYLYNDNLLIVADNRFYLYNLKTNNLRESKSEVNGKTFLQLKNGDIVLVSYVSDKLGNQMILKRYNPEKDTIVELGKLIVPRGSVYLYNMTLLPDGNILVNGGQNIEKSGNFSGDGIYENRTEIFNPETGKSVLIKNMPYKRPGGYSVLLKDGRILFYFDKYACLYVPRK